MPTLRSAILVSLLQREMSPDLPFSLLTADKGRLLHHDETEYWDYKEILDLRNPLEEARFAKHVLGFHNTLGGALFVGITDDFHVTGVTQGQVLDSSILIAKLQKYAERPILLFSDLIPIAAERRFVWIIFIPKREGPPLAASKTGPKNKAGQPVISKDVFYRRVHAETRPCIGPRDLEALFLGSGTDHLKAYTYDIDEPFFRLLAPSCEHFVGRKDDLFRLATAFRSRNHIIALDGPGGVGKSEIAIRFARRLYDNKALDFIVSLSAKSKVWHEGRIEYRRPAFSGLTSFLREVATVLDIEPSDDVDALSENICTLIGGSRGVLLVDNIESVDATVLEFLMDRIPPPVKVLVTSRVDRSIGARTVSIREMIPQEARELLIVELERVRYFSYLEEKKHVQELLDVTGRNPLAIKWAAALADSYKSLRLAASKLRRHTTQQREFLEFCFETMFDTLSPLARDVAVLATYLGDEWSIYSVAVALNAPPDHVKVAVEELKDRGIIVASTAADLSVNRLLPLTVDYLHQKWNSNKEMREAVANRLDDAVATADRDTPFLKRSAAEKAEALRRKSEQRVREGQLEEARQLVKLALQYASTPELRFLDGRIDFEAGRRWDGIAGMRSALSDLTDDSQLWAERLYLGRTLLSFGGAKDEPEGLRILSDTIPVAPSVPTDVLRDFCVKALERREYLVVSRLLDRTSGRDLPRCYWLCKYLLPALGNRDFLHWCGVSLVRVLRSASRAALAEEAERREFRTLLKKIEVHV